MSMIYLIVSTTAAFTLALTMLPLKLLMAALMAGFALVETWPNFKPFAASSHYLHFS